MPALLQLHGAAAHRPKLASWTRPCEQVGGCLQGRSAAPRSAELPSVLIRVGARASRPTPSPPMDEARPGRRSGHLRTTIYAGIIGGPSAPMKALACTQEVQ